MCCWSSPVFFISSVLNYTKPVALFRWNCHSTTPHSDPSVNYKCEKPKWTFSALPHPSIRETNYMRVGRHSLLCGSIRRVSHTVQSLSAQYVQHTTLHCLSLKGARNDFKWEDINAIQLSKPTVACCITHNGVMKNPAKCIHLYSHPAGCMFKCLVSYCTVVEHITVCAYINCKIVLFLAVNLV